MKGTEVCNKKNGRKKKMGRRQGNGEKNDIQRMTQKAKTEERQEKAGKMKKMGGNKEVSGKHVARKGERDDVQLHSKRQRESQKTEGKSHTNCKERFQEAERKSGERRGRARGSRVKVKMKTDNYHHQTMPLAKARYRTQMYLKLSAPNWWTAPQPIYSYLPLPL